MKGVLAVTDEELVSVDFRGNPASSIVDAQLTKWSTATWPRCSPGTTTSGGFSQRMKDLLHMMANRDGA
jgi:glyceraldehyde-3-phosphate dehydrogenase/erythrose-4-phosphate dehydrogenase